MATTLPGPIRTANSGLNCNSPGTGNWGVWPPSTRHYLIRAAWKFFVNSIKAGPHVGYSLHSYWITTLFELILNFHLRL